jgi:hypothetical protein
MAAPLIYPNFVGRLGNGLFQIAACIGYSKKYNVKWGIKKGYIERSFNANQIDRFLPHLPVCENKYRRYNEFQHQWAGTEFNYHEIPFHPLGVELNGFWQSEKYFENAKDEVRKWLKLDFVEGYQDYVSIHVRRGDYVDSNDNFPPVTLKYLNLAMESAYTRTGIKKFLVFSDDIQWCKDHLKSVDPFISFEFSEGRNEWEDLCLMASCGHNIIANSSFSWWAAWLNPNPDKVIISPSHKRGNWFGFNNGVKHDCIDLIPEGWIQIEYR